MKIIDSYLTLEKSSSSEIKITKSKFISHAFPVNSNSEIPDRIKEIKKKYFDAAHFPYAFRIGADKNNFRVSDDGEPSGSAGKPVLEAIDKYNLTNILIIVVRYFGGTKLGVGGLRRAFFEAADLCLSKAMIVEKLITEKINLEFDYRFMNVMMNLIEAGDMKLTENNSDEKCKLTLEVRLSKITQLKKELISLTNGNIKIF
ncbi:MAG: YigZ family protein [Bacteroidota bacterium]|nr:YigZ family protein [Bacteroidota bacterium]